MVQNQLTTRDRPGQTRSTARPKTNWQSDLARWFDLDRCSDLDRWFAPGRRSKTTRHFTTIRRSKKPRLDRVVDRRRSTLSSVRRRHIGHRVSHPVKRSRRPALLIYSNDNCNNYNVTR